MIGVLEPLINSNLFAQQNGSNIPPKLFISMQMIIFFVIFESRDRMISHAKWIPFGVWIWCVPLTIWYEIRRCATVYGSDECTAQFVVGTLWTRVTWELFTLHSMHLFHSSITIAKMMRRRLRCFRNSIISTPCVSVSMQWRLLFFCCFIY